MNYRTVGNGDTVCWTSSQWCAQEETIIYTGVSEFIKRL